jgi:hypothetical protein
MDIPVSIELYDEVLGYLGKDPYEKSFQLIHKLQSNAHMHMAAQAGQIPPMPSAAPAAPVEGEVMPADSIETTNT